MLSAAVAGGSKLPLMPGMFLAIFAVSAGCRRRGVQPHIRIAGPARVVGQDFGRVPANSGPMLRSSACTHFVTNTRTSEPRSLLMISWGVPNLMNVEEGHAMDVAGVLEHYLGAVRSCECNRAP